MKREKREKKKKSNPENAIAMLYLDIQPDSPCPNSGPKLWVNPKIKKITSIPAITSERMIFMFLP
jgi:hypothetical protein